MEAKFYIINKDEHYLYGQIILFDERDSDQHNMHAYYLFFSKCCLHRQQIHQQIRTPTKNHHESGQDKEKERLA